MGILIVQLIRIDFNIDGANKYVTYSIGEGNTQASGTPQNPIQMALVNPHAKLGGLVWYYTAECIFL